VWSAGIILVEMFIGLDVVNFSGKTIAEVIKNVKNTID
jgi:hypothetical protein